MLRGLRNASSNWLGKSIMALVMGLLVVSFAIWGIGDIFRGFGRSTVAKIGSTEVSIEQFRQIYNEKLQQAGRQIGRPISSDQARTLGLDRQILAQLVADITLDARARALRLGISDTEIAKRITSDPSFQGPNGRFDRSRFDAIIRQQGYTEPRLIADQRRQDLRRQLAGTVMSGLQVPNAVVETIDRYQNEQRSIDYVLIDREKAGEVAPATAEDLAKYFNERRILFRAPEYRKLVVVSLIPSDQAKWIEISDTEAKHAYEERLVRYTTPERRHIQQIVFPNMEDARAAADRLAGGTTFADLAKERDLTEKDIDLGTLPKAGIIDRTVGDVAFALKPGETSAPVQGRFGSAIVLVDKIEPEQVQAYDVVAADLKREIATERAKAEMLSAYDKIEDQRSEGKTLAEAAAGLNLASRTFDLDRSGRDPAGEPAKDVPDATRLLNAAFTTEIGVDNDPLQVDGGYIWYEVAGITPARDRSLDEVKSQVEERQRADEIATRLKTKAAQIVDKIKNGSTLAEAATEIGLKVESKSAIKRTQPSSPLSQSAITAVFRSPKGVAVAADAEQPAEQIVFQITDIIVPTLDVAAPEAKNIRDVLNRSLMEDIYSQYVAQIETDIGVTINQAAVRQVVTGVVQTDDID
jgi:peptidyl-prolyl cis-trans isomerase D